MEKQWHPGKLLSISSAYWRGCALQAAVRLKIFSALAEKNIPAEELALSIGSEETATALLLDAMTAMGLLAKSKGYYCNTDFTLRFLVESSPQYMGHIILHHHHLLDGWAQLDNAVLTGQPVQRRSYGREAERESFLMGMFNLAMQIAPEVAGEVDLSGRSKLLDLGGGPGTFAIHFCMANPDLKAVIFDRETTAPFARKTVGIFGLGERIDFIPGDFNTDTISGGPYDVAWLSHVLHSNTYDDCCALIAKCVGSLESGGLILIHDFILDNNKDGPEFPALFSLNMLLAGNGGRAYSQQEIFDMLACAGIRNPACHSFRAKNDSSIIYGILP